VASWAFGLPLAAAISLLAHRARTLSPSGALAALVAGVVAMGAGWSWGIVLIAYFVTAAMLSRFRAGEKLARANGRIEKGGPRDAMQVLANGGVFVATALGYWILPHPLWQALGAGAIAASAADTWATEIGTLWGGIPRSILTGRPVSVGASGGVSALGFGASATGAAFVAILVAVVGWPAVAVVAAIVGGIAGCALDSVLGAAWQARRWCATCELETEARLHRCGTATTHRAGMAWLDNDVVNAIATFGGAIIGAGVAEAGYR
jgi:uncharacterized protein (TIGR00297 family)